MKKLNRTIIYLHLSENTGIYSAFLHAGRTMKQLAEQISKRRTFAIISHPDAGKTTLTEKFLLYGGAVQMAGSVTARKQQRATTSDWMELERKRGISVSSTVLQFDYEGYRVNLLDTPGHKDFSEDTYRVLTAVDSVVMVIDSAKGIESQTRKLFEICRRREIPIFTFVNKLDRPSREPLAIIDEIEDTLQLSVFPMNWPLGTGIDFKGVYDRFDHKLHLFEKIEKGSTQKAPVSVKDIHDEAVRKELGDDLYHKVKEEIELLDVAGESFDPEDVLQGNTTPIFFGSALNNFGVQMMLDAFLKYAALPAPRQSRGETIPTHHDKFSGFIFKILANMDPNHRDRIAFVRICSGKFERDMAVVHSRSDKKLKLSSAHKLFGNSRETVEEAYAGDIVGIVGHSSFGIGDTLSETADIEFNEIPRFTPECFSYIRNPQPSNFKRFKAGMDQLLQEGVVQEIKLHQFMQNERLLAAVGPLQFEVVQYRMSSEYNAETRLEPAPWQVMRWVDPAWGQEKLDELLLPQGSTWGKDVDEKPVVLFPTEWAMNYFQGKNPDVGLSPLPF